MDFQLLKTFQEVAATGSFGAAAGRLFVTQSAVSLRVLRLEDQLGRSLFDRNKGGAVLTAAGREFQGHATMILHNWEQARQKVSAVENAAKVLALAAQPSLGPYFGFDWLDRIREELPDIILRFEGARPGALAELILSGDAQAILTCQELIRPGLASEYLMEDHLVMVSPWAKATVDGVIERYAMIDWGTEFRRAHDEALPMLAGAKLSLGMGALAAWYLRDRPFAAYLPAHYVCQPMADGILFLVKDAPSFANPSWVIWRDDMDPALRAVAKRTLFNSVQRAKCAIAQVARHL